MNHPTKPSIKPPTVSVIIPSYRQAATVALTLRSLRQQTFTDFEVIVVDSSHDETTELIRNELKSFPSSKLIENRNQLGAAIQRNQGIKESRGEWLTFLDTDVILSKDWLETMLAKAVSRPDAELVSASTIANGNSRFFWSRIIHWAEFGEFAPETSRKPKKFVPSAALLTHRTVPEKWGGFIEALISEDLITINHWRNQGCAIYWEPDVTCWHLNRHTASTVLERIFLLGKSSAIVRRKLNLSGSWITKTAVLCLALWLVRLFRISRRVLSTGEVNLPRFLWHLPALLLVTLGWNFGFFVGSLVQVEK